MTRWRGIGQACHLCLMSNLCVTEQCYSAQPDIALLPFPGHKQKRKSRLCVCVGVQVFEKEYLYVCMHACESVCTEKHTHMHHSKYHKLSSIRKFPSLTLIRICIQPKLIILPMVTQQGLHIKKPEVCIRQSSLMNLPFSLCQPLTLICQSHCSLRFFCRLNQICSPLAARVYKSP